MKKNLFKITFTFIIMMMFTGCVEAISQKGVTIAIPASKITNALEREFPVSQNFQYGKVTLSNPKAFLQSGSDRIQAGTRVSFSSSLIPTQSGSLMISGKPIFDAKTGSIYLTNPDINNLEFNGYKLTSFIQGSLKESIMPIVNQIFRTHPIYKLKQNSLQSAFVKDIRVSNGSLLITFGI